MLFEIAEKVAAESVLGKLIISMYPYYSLEIRADPCSLDEPKTIFTTLLFPLLPHANIIFGAVIDFYIDHAEILSIRKVDPISPNSSSV